MDCQWQEWGPWSQCSSTCGNGQRSSLRIVKQEAKNGGEPCNEIFEKHETCTNSQCQGTAWYMFQLIQNSFATSYMFMPLIIVTRLIFQIQMVNAVFQTRILKITTQALQASGVKIAVIKDIVQIHAKQ